jgi:hypothetical protein
MMSFIEISGAVAFHHFKDEIHPVILQMWEHFRTYALYFLQYRVGQHTERQIRAAQNHLFAYAELAEKHLEGKLLTLLLHRAVCHIPDEALHVIPTAFNKEDYGERDVRRTKGPNTGHGLRRPAQAAANRCCMDMSLELCRVEMPDIAAPIMPVKRRRAAKKTDRGDAHGVQLLEGLSEANTGEDGDVVRHSIICIL